MEGHREKDTVGERGMDIEMQRQREAQGNIKLDRDDKTGQIRADRESTRGLKHGTEKWIRKQSRIKSVVGYENKHAEGKRGMMPKRGGKQGIMMQRRKIERWHV